MAPLSAGRASYCARVLLQLFTLPTMEWGQAADTVSFSLGACARVRLSLCSLTRGKTDAAPITHERGGEESASRTLIFPHSLNVSVRLLSMPTATFILRFLRVIRRREGAVFSYDAQKKSLSWITVEARNCHVVNSRARKTSPPLNLLRS